LEETPKENYPFSNRQFHATFISPLTKMPLNPWFLISKGAKIHVFMVE